MNKMRYHTIERTSPKGKGMKFVGTCILCGTTNLTPEDVFKYCSNQRNLTQDEALIEAIDGKSK